MKSIIKYIIYFKLYYSILYMAHIVAKIFIGKTTGIFMPTSLPFKLFTFPLVMSVLSIYVPPIRSFLRKLMSLEIDRKNFGFRKFFKSKKVRTTVLLLYIFWLLIGQLILAPITSPGASFDFKSGKFTALSITDVPKVLFSTLLLIKIPFKVAKGFLTTGKSLVGNNKNIKNLTRIVSIVIGFFAIYLIKRGITPLDIIITAVLSFLTLFTPIFKKFFGLLQIRFPRITFKNIFSNKYNAWIAFIFVVFWLLFTLLVVRHIPGYEKINDKVADMIGGEVSLKILFLDFITYLIVPLFFAGKLAAKLGKQGKTDAERKKLFRRGFTLGYTLGILLMTMVRNLIPGSVKDKMEEAQELMDAKIEALKEKIPGGDDDD